MLVKSLNAGDHLKHLQETFDILRKHNMKLNPKKCAFGVGSGKFLWFLVSQKGTEVNPVKIKAIEDILDQLISVKKVQRLNRRGSAGVGNDIGVWNLFMDGSSNVKGFGLRIVLIAPLGETLRQAIKIVLLTNNEAEYEALVAELELALWLCSEVIKIKCDSQMVVNQVYGIFDTKEERIQ
uniref:RNase H type-1 domain-containing protein n=1 Tax=Nicotiana tabacum TaxID=4097 RepID=A0A1S4B6T9_TOBAC|nr:PREDICTED: uncharacterized protein LOC107805089 [Nicotiana tabacum]